MTVEEAIVAIRNQIETLNQLNMEKLQVELNDILARCKERERELTAGHRVVNTQTRQDRKALRDEMIPQWCLENLRPGMVVKVKAASRTTLRQVIELDPASRWHPGSFCGHHCHYVRRKNAETGKYTTELVLDGYITDHVLTNVQGVVFNFDAAGRAVVTKIMDLVDGVTT